MRTLIWAVVLLGLILGAWLGFVWWYYLKDQGTELDKDPTYRDAITVEVTEVRDGIYMLTGDGVNVAVFVGTDAALVIDTDVRWMTPKILEAISGISNVPVAMLINTHAHGDHRGGNALFRQGGADIVALEETRLGIERGTYPGTTEDDYPNVIVSDGHSMTVGGQTVTLHHAPFAHSGGDLMVRFMPANVIVAGDVFVEDRIPYIGRPEGATLDGHLDGHALLLGLADDETLIVPGHGVLSNRSDVLRVNAELQTVRDYMVWLKGLGLPKRFFPAFHPLYAWPMEKHLGRGAERFWINNVFETLP